MHKKINSFVQQLRKKRLTLALAESMTCGMATEKLATCIGTSDMLAGSVVCYTPRVKKDLLGVPAAMIKKYSCESPQVTEKLARNLGRLIKADICAAITGLASEGGSESREKPVGTVFFCVITGNRVYHQRKLFRGSPLVIREKSCIELYRFILEAVRKTK